MKTSMMVSSRIIMIFMLSVLGMSKVNAEPDDEWEFEVTPYMFLSGMDGKVGFGNVVTEFDLDPDEVIDFVDEAFFMTFVARKGRWIFGFDGQYSKLGAGDSRSVSGPFGNVDIDGTVDITSKMILFQPMVGYRIIDTSSKLDVIGGARYTELDNVVELKITTTIPSFPGGALKLKDVESWVDPIVGLRGTLPLSDNWAVLGYGDIGGFGVGSDFTYQVTAALRWNINERYSAKIGYRRFYQDYDKDGFIWKTTLSGLVAGVGIRF